MDEVKEDKQTYLRHTIMDKGIDVTKFIEYIASVKADGENIDNWQMDELIRVVDDFKTRRSTTAQSKVRSDFVALKDPTTSLSKTKSEYVENKVTTNGQNRTKTELIQSKHPSNIQIINTSELSDARTSNPSINTQTLKKIDSEDQSPDKSRMSLARLTENESTIIVCDTVRIAAMDEDISVAKNKIVLERPSINLLSKNYISKAVVNDYYAVFNLKKYPTSELLQQKSMVVKICDPKEISAGMFSRNYTSYRVITYPYNWTTDRRYSDFKWQKECLQKEYSLCVIPPIEIKTQIKKMEKEFVQKRMSFMQNFMNTICNNPEQRSSPAVKAFLEIVDHKVFEKKQKEILNTKTKQTNFRSNYLDHGKKVFEEGFRMEDLFSVLPGVESIINDKYKSYTESTNDLIQQCFPLESTLKNLSKQLLAEVDSVNNTCWKMSDIYSKLKTQYENFNKKVPIGKMKVYETLYADINHPNYPFNNCQIFCEFAIFTLEFLQKQ